MLIKNITCHDVYNYGASLQAYALQEFLKKKGHDVEIINYKPAYLSFPYKLSTYVDEKSKYQRLFKKSSLFLYLYSLIRYCYYLLSIKKKWAYDKFTQNYLRLTKQYSSYGELFNNSPAADVYIVGSDQVWNSTTMENGKDPAFFLQFGDKNVKRYAYAASFGSSELDAHVELVQKKWLKSFNGISVREKSGVDIVERLGFLSTHVCDPVFLLTKEEWGKICSKTNFSDGFVLIYNLPPLNTQLIHDAQECAKKYGLKIVSISPFKINAVDFNLLSAGPLEFVSLFKEASYVFTNSFHGTSFSLIMNKQFFSYNYHSINNSSRLFSVLEDVALLSRLNCTDVVNQLNTPIDYKTVSKKIEELSNRGQLWLTNILN